MTAQVDFTPVSDRLINVHEVGRMLGCSWRSVYRLADAGKFPIGRKVGSLRRWRLSEVEQFISGEFKSARTGGRGR